MKNKISIIVPIYNTEQYLEKCIDSIINQTFKNFELILVDDGSTDRSLEICNKYFLQDSRIKVIHKKNGGLSSARNAGIDVATGDYIGFVDSDDYIDKDMYMVLYDLAEKYSADIAMCNLLKTSSRDFKEDNNERKYNIYLYERPLESLYNENAIEYVVAWNKLYKGNLFKNIRYPIGLYHEDQYIIHGLLYKSNKMVYSEKPLYYYYCNTNSIMHTPTLNKKIDYLYALINRINLCKEIGEFKLKDISVHKFTINYINIYNEIITNDIVENKINKCNIFFKKNIFNILSNSFLTNRQKIMCIIYCINPKLYINYLKWKNRNIIAEE